MLAILRHSGCRAVILKIDFHVVFEFSDFNIATVINIKTGNERIEIKSLEQSTKISQKSGNSRKTTWMKICFSVFFFKKEPIPEIMMCFT